MSQPAQVDVGPNSRCKSLEKCTDARRVRTARCWMRFRKAETRTMTESGRNATTFGLGDRSGKESKAKNNKEKAKGRRES